MEVTYTVRLHRFCLRYVIKLKALPVFGAAATSKLRLRDSANDFATGTFRYFPGASSRREASQRLEVCGYGPNSLNEQVNPSNR